MSSIENQQLLLSDDQAGDRRRIRWLTGRWCPLYCIAESAPGKRWSDLCNPDGPGVYRLVAIDLIKLGILAVPLNRVCGIDPSGTLYIGRSKSLRTRLSSLVRTHDPTKRIGAIFGASHIMMTKKLTKRFPPKCLAITWRRADSASSSQTQEATLLRDYKDSFGELPPMNAQ
jgi:hypothetical protein